MAGDGGGGAAGAVGEEFSEDVALGAHELAGEFRNVDELGGDGADGQAGGNEVVEKLVETEFGESGGAAEDQHGRKNGLNLNRARGGLAIGKNRWSKVVRWLPITDSIHVDFVGRRLQVNFNGRPSSASWRST